MLRRTLIPSALLLLAPAFAAGAADVPVATVALEVFTEPVPGRIAEAAPPRFVMMESGEVYVGGTSHVFVGRLAKGEAGPIEKQMALVLKLPGLRSAVTLGPGSQRRRLVLGKGKPVEIVANGDPAAAPPALRALTALLATLEGFGHPSLRPYHPASYRLTAREAPMAGGCRPWTFPIPLTTIVASPATVTTADDWPTGALSASVCSGEKTYQVNLRPLLPGEK